MADAAVAGEDRAEVVQLMLHLALETSHALPRTAIAAYKPPIYWILMLLPSVCVSGGRRLERPQQRRPMAAAVTDPDGN
jgi:hypothetical protein